MSNKIAKIKKQNQKVTALLDEVIANPKSVSKEGLEEIIVSLEELTTDIKERLMQAEKKQQ